MRSLLCGAAVLLVSCAHQRVAPSAGGDRSAQSGVPLEFTGPAQLPEGTKVTWDFGDGTAPAEGSHVLHAFPRAGSFTVTQTVQDQDGDKRQATAQVQVSRRSVPAAVPADARATLIAQQPWARVQTQREVAQQLGVRDLYEQIAGGISRALGFDVTRPDEVLQNGIDPDEGLAIFTVREDPEALVVAVGVADEAKAEQAVRRLLAQDGGDAQPQLRPFALTEAKLAGGGRAVVGTRNNGSEQVAYAFKLGYLYLRTPAATDPLLALRGVDALGPDNGLERDANYLSTVGRVGAGDFVFYSAPPPQGGKSEANAEALGPLKRTLRELGASAFALNLRNDRLAMRLFAQLRNLSGEKLVAAFTPTTNPDPEFARHLPSGAVAYVKVSGSPDALWRELGRAAGDRKQEFEERMHAFSGIDVEKEWLPLFTGNAGLAFYLDAAALLEAFMGEQVAGFDKSTLLAAIEIREGKAAEVRAVLDKASKELGDKLSLQREEQGGAAVYLVGEGGLQAAQKGQVLYVSLGGPRGGQHAQGALAMALGEDKGKARPLAEVLKKAGVEGFELPQAQLAWLDIRSAVAQLSKAAGQQGAGIFASLVAEKVQGLRDALLVARPSVDGVTAELTVRFHQPRVSGHPGGRIDEKAAPGQPVNPPQEPPGGH